MPAAMAPLRLADMRQKSVHRCVHGAWLLYACVIVGACGPAASPEPAADVTPKNSVQAPVEANAPQPSQAELAERYRTITEGLDGGQAASAADLARVRGQLREIADLATDPHLRANASLAAGALFEEAGDTTSAIAFFRQAVAAVPDEAPTHAMLALALAKGGQLPAAIDVQQRVVALLPNDLEAWLHLGEMNIKAGRAEAGADAYATYEKRRAAILDGLTLKSKSGEYLLPAADRVAMAAALEVATDNGTGLALLYALDSDPDASVRAEIARVMGTQRLLGYKQQLATAMGKEIDADARATMEWALAEIERDGRETAPGPAPVGPEDAPTDTGPPGSAPGSDLNETPAGKDAGAGTEPSAPSARPPASLPTSDGE